MARKLLPLLLFLSSFSQVAASEDRLGVLYSKFTTLIFPAAILDVEIGSGAYYTKVKGKYLLLRAKHKKVAPTSLFVRYGKQRQCYVVELFPDPKAPLKHYIAADNPELPDTNPAQASPVDTLFADHQQQEYYTLGTKQQGVEVILTNILHADQVTYLRFFIKNTATVPCSVNYYSFEYITFLNNFFFFKRAKRKPVKPISISSLIHLPAKHGAYFVFAIPYYVSEGGLEVLFGESDGERRFTIFIPSAVLLNARRMQS